MRRHWKKIAIAIAAVIVVVIGGSFIYAKVLNDAPDPLDAGDLADAIEGTDSPVATDAPVVTDAPVAESTPAGGTTGTTAAPSDLGDASASGVEGDWAASTDSTLRYRVQENINGFDTEGVGETNQVTGTLTIDGTVATAGEFTVDMTTFSSDNSRRDGQFDGRIMSVDQFPTSTFVLTEPIDFGAIPADGEQITVTATGDLTLRGVTNPVTFELTATFSSGRIGVLGNIPVVFADYDIPNPSFGTISTEDNGLLEFILVFDRATA